MPRKPRFLTIKEKRDFFAKVVRGEEFTTAEKVKVIIEDTKLEQYQKTLEDESEPIIVPPTDDTVKELLQFLPPPLPKYRQEVKAQHQQNHPPGFYPDPE